MRIALILIIAALIGTCSSAPPLLDQVLETGELRVVTRDSPTSYVVSPDGISGPEYDLMTAFADELGVELVIELRELGTQQRGRELMHASVAGEAVVFVPETGRYSSVMSEAPGEFGEFIRVSKYCTALAAVQALGGLEAEDAADAE